MKIDQVILDTLRGLAATSRAVDSYAGVEPDTLDALLDELAALETKLADAVPGDPCQEIRWFEEKNLVRQGARHLVRSMPVRDLVRHFGPGEQHLLAALVDHATEGLGAKKRTQEAFRNHVALMAEHQRGE